MRENRFYAESSTQNLEKRVKTTSKVSLISFHIIVSHAFIYSLHLGNGTPMKGSFILEGTLFRRLAEVSIGIAN